VESDRRNLTAALARSEVDDEVWTGGLRAGWQMSGTGRGFGFEVGSSNAKQRVRHDSAPEEREISRDLAALDSLAAQSRCTAARWGVKQSQLNPDSRARWREKRR